MPTFRPHVEYMNQSVLQLGQYPRIVVEQGVRPVEPEFVSPARMTEIRQARRPGAVSAPAPVTGFTEGHTKTYFYMRFENFRSQWRQIRTGRSSVNFWEFTGGTIYLSVAVKVYVVDHRRPRADSTSRAIFALLVEHEYHHVADEIDIVTNYLPERVTRNHTVQRYLVQRNPVHPDVFAASFAGYATPRAISEDVWFRQTALAGIGLELSTLNIYIVEHNRRSSHRDAPDGETGRYQARVSQLSTAMQLGRPWSGGAGDDPWRD